MGYEETLKQLKRIKVDALYGKKKHFNAADRKQGYRHFIGVPAILINIVAGSALFKILCEQDGSVLWPAIMAFVAAILTGLQTYFDFNAKVNGHRNIGNRYLEVYKACGRIDAYISDTILSQENNIVEKVENVSKEIDLINRDAEAFPTNNADYKKAQDSFKDGNEFYTEEELNA
jgi:hypothetical protein